MASASLSVSTIFFFLFFLSRVRSDKSCHFEAMYQFGDSISDTGNLIREGPVGANSVSARPPYGKTYFHRPTGRYCNGRLMIDYIAAAFELPFLNPYLETNSDFSHGVNFAVAGATALDSSFFTARNIHIPSTNSPLSVQLNWFRTYLSNICNTPTECAAKLKRSLVMMGEVGGNDYNYPFFQGKSIDEIQTYVPYIVGAITEAIREVIRLGAVHIVVPGNFPNGCFPIYLTYFQTSDPGAYDDMGCLTYLNEFNMYQNDYLHGAMALLRLEYPEVTLIYFDNYNAFQSVLRHAPYLGFNKKSLLHACCGTGGEYNYNSSRSCGYPEVPVCPNPEQYISWDGVHLTQMTYHHMSQILITSLCPESSASGSLFTKLNNFNLQSKQMTYIDI